MPRSAAKGNAAHCCLVLMMATGVPGSVGDRGGKISQISQNISKHLGRCGQQVPFAEMLDHASELEDCGFLLVGPGLVSDRWLQRAHAALVDLHKEPGFHDRM
eukprot:SAG31_NODE_1791_length_7258_cov_12.040928_7_plen_103_part_00